MGGLAFGGFGPGGLGDVFAHNSQQLAGAGKLLGVMGEDVPKAARPKAAKSKTAHPVGSGELPPGHPH